MSKETCELEWYQAFSAGCAAAGAVTGGALGAALGGVPGAGAGLVAGAVIGYCSCRLAGRLRKVTVTPPFDPASGLTMITGELISTGRSNPWLPLGDGDWLFNVATNNRTVLEVAFDGSAACVRTEKPPDFLHCEITSAIGTAGCIGQMVGAVVGAAVGTAVGIAAAVACIATGIFAPLCLLLAFLLAALITAIITEVGEYIGKAIGAAIDAATNPPGIIPNTAEVGNCVIFSGDWVTDRDHGWNELHDIKGAMVFDNPGSVGCFRAIGAVGAGLKTHKAPGVPE